MYIKSLNNWILGIFKKGGESLLHVVLQTYYAIPTDRLMYTTLMAMANVKGGGLQLMAPLTNLVERYYGFMSLQETMILWLSLTFTELYQ